MNRLTVGGWLIVSLFQILSAIQYAPFESTFDPSECALILNQHSETNLLSGVLQYGSAPTCVTYDAVNQAYLEARKRIKLKLPNDDQWKPEHVATVGELLLDISSELAKTYGMSGDDIEKGLPFIDTSKTLIREVCPAYLSDVQCHAGKYRRLDGLCNNIANPTWGAINTPFTRLMPPQFADLMSHPRESIYGSPLPLPRIVSRTIHPDEGFHDHAGTVMIVAWGQFMDHDFTLTATPLDRFSKNEPEECCNRPPHLKHPYCMDVVIPADDYFYSKYGVRCQDFVRSFPSVRPGCRLGSRTPFNTLTGVIDGNTVYGVTDEFGRYLRQGELGLLRMNPVFSEYGLKDLLPLKLDYPDEGCARFNGTEYCFEAGEIRVNEQLVLTCMHTLMARQHNTVARELAKVNPHWDDETLYQEARRVVIAQIQHITFNEFLPIVLGKEVMQKFGLMLEKTGYWAGYDETINPNIIDAFSAAAFRFGHSLLPTAVERWSKAHKFIASKRLSDLIRRPYDLYRAGVLDEYLMGLMNQVAQAMDDSITQEVTNNLFKKKGQHFGLDLVAFNMQRGREFGVPGYMYFRKFCGLPLAEGFDELFDSMPNSTVNRYKSIFESTWDVDLWSGGVSEKPLPGSMIGPTFACVIATQMNYVRRGDRFWYELPNQPSSFTPEQLQEIKKTKLSRIICDNTDLIDTIQVYPMVLPDYEINPRVACKSGVLPKIDWSKWAEFDNSGKHPPTRDSSEEGDGEVQGPEEEAEEEEVKNDYDGEPQEEHAEDEEQVSEEEEEIEEEEEEEDEEARRPQANNEEDKHPPKKPAESVEVPRKTVQSYNVTRAVFIKTFNRTIVQLPVAITHGVDLTRGNPNKTSIKFPRSDPATRQPPTVISVTPEVFIRNSKVKPLRFFDQGNQSVIIAKKVNDSGNNKVKKDEKTTEKVKFVRRRDIAYYSSAENDYSGSPGGDYSGPPPIRDADHEYDSEYEYNAKADREGQYEDREPDTYDIHGYKSQTDAPRKLDQPAYLIAKDEGEGHPPEMTSGKPVTFKSPKKKKKKNRRAKSRNRATSSVSISMNGEHHHHHFYDDLKETHENPPEGYTHNPQFLIPKLPPDIYKKYPGKHKHFHHIRRPGDPPIAIPDDDDDEENFNPGTLTDKDHEDAYKTYDEDVIVDEEGEVEENPSTEINSEPETTRAPIRKPRVKSKKPKSSRKKIPRPAAVNILKVSSMKSKKSKEEVDRIFDTVERAMRDPGLNVAMPPSNQFRPLWNMGFHPRT